MSDNRTIIYDPMLDLIGGSEGTNPGTGAAGVMVSLTADPVHCQAFADHQLVLIKAAADDDDEAAAP